MTYVAIKAPRSFSPCATPALALPFGYGQKYANDLDGWKGHLASGWSLASIITLQSGFPLTPQLSYNPSNNGDTRNPVRHL